MHPLKVEQPWPFEQWWAPLSSQELGRELLGRTILDRPVVFYRKENGDPVALHGVCPHRSYPLAASCLERDNIRCGYHGFAFGPTGECVEMPSQASVPQGAVGLHRYPVIERGGLIWIWTGQENNADPALIPDIAAHGMRDDWASEWNEPITVNCRYTLLIDNLMDLTHASYIHVDTLPGSAAVVEVPPEIISSKACYNVARLICGVPRNPYNRLQFPALEGAIDRNIDAEYFGPCLIRTGGPIHSHESGEYLGTQNFMHLLTPVTRFSVQYRVVTTRDFNRDSAELSAFLVKTAGTMGAVTSQDVIALESVERMLQSLDEAPREISCRADTGALAVRHRLEKQIRQETRVGAVSPARRRREVA